MTNEYHSKITESEANSNGDDWGNQRTAYMLQCMTLSAINGALVTGNIDKIRLLAVTDEHFTTDSENRQQNP